MGAPFLVERGVDPSEEGLGPALVMRLLLDLPERDSYFRPLASQPSMAAALWSTIRELRMAGVRASDLTADRFESRPKHVEFVALLTAYESFLTTKARGDRATVFQEALQHVDWCPIQPPDCWTTMPEIVWSRSNAGSSMHCQASASSRDRSRCRAWRPHAGFRFFRPTASRPRPRTRWRF